MITDFDPKMLNFLNRSDIKFHLELLKSRMRIQGIHVISKSDNKIELSSTPNLSLLVVFKNGIRVYLGLLKDKKSKKFEFFIVDVKHPFRGNFNVQKPLIQKHLQQKVRSLFPE